MIDVPRHSGWAWGALLLLVGALLPPASHAQRFITGPSMALDDATSMLRNPATLGFHRTQIALGAKAHHVGLGSASGVPLRQGYLAASTPFLVGDWLGVGGAVRYFDTPIFKKRAFGLSVSGRFLQVFSVGARVSALNLSYNRSEFVGVEPDPVFEQGTGKTTLTGTLGLFAKPLPALNLAAGVRNLNRPNLALGSGTFRAEPEIFGGASYAVGPIRARAEVSHGEYGLDVQAGLEAYSTDGSYIRVGSDAMFSAGRVEGQLHVGGPLSVNYQYSLPTSSLRSASTGSHRFGVVYEFGRAPEPPEMPEPPSLMLEAERTEVAPRLRPSLYISSPHPTMQHLEKRVERAVNVPPAVEAALAEQGLGRLDSSFASTRGRTPGRPVDAVPDYVKLPDVLTATYDSTFGRLSQRLAVQSPNTLQLIAGAEDSLRTYGLYNRLRENTDLSPEQLRVIAPTDTAAAAPADSLRLPRETRLHVLNPERTTFTLLFPYLEGREGLWRVRIQDRAGVPVRLFRGRGVPPAQLAWSWTDDQGEPLDQGVYTYVLEWEGLNGRTYRSNKKKFTVQKTVRKITFEVTQQPGVLEAPSDAIEIRTNDDPVPNKK
jgi:hypothetical protein